MAETPRSRRLAWQIIFLALAAALTFIGLLPLGQAALPGPDLFVLFAFAWVLRRPDYVPVLLVAVVLLLADFVFLRPPGLWAALGVLGLELLRVREGPLRDVPFAVEWGIVSVVIAAMFLANALVLAIFFVEQPPLGLTLIQMIATLLSYPAVVAVTAFGFGLRKAAPGEVDNLGRRL